MEVLAPLNSALFYIRVARFHLASTFLIVVQPQTVDKMGVVDYSLGPKRPWDAEKSVESKGESNSDGSGNSHVLDWFAGKRRKIGADPQGQMDEVKEVLKSCLDGVSTTADQE